MSDKKEGDADALAREVVEILNTLLAKGDWDSTLFLRLAAKDFRTLRDEGMKLLEKHNAVDVEKKPAHSPDRSGFVLIYISIFQAVGNKALHWQKAIDALEGQIVSRPIYREATFVEEMIRAKKNATHDAYVAIWVKRDDIIPPYAGKPAEDRFGHELLTLKEGTVQQDNIAELVLNKHKYPCIDGKIAVPPESTL